MTQLKIHTDPRVDDIFSNYPETARQKMLNLRGMILEVAEEAEDISSIEETLKWGEPSYLVKKGSTLRMDWKERSPDQYAMYFKCTSRLVPTFKMFFGKTFKFEGDRAIIFHMDDIVPEAELKQCIAATLRYHKVKHLPTLGI